MRHLVNALGNLTLLVLLAIAYFSHSLALAPAILVVWCIFRVLHVIARSLAPEDPIRPLLSSLLGVLSLAADVCLLAAIFTSSMPLLTIAFWFYVGGGALLILLVAAAGAAFASEGI